MNLTYAEITYHYRVSLHELGWSERRVTRSGLRRFLISYYYHRQLTVLGRNPTEWELIWRANVWAQQEALNQWHSRIPRRYSDGDRTRVAWLLAKDRMWGQHGLDYGLQAERWAASRLPLVPRPSPDPSPE